MLWANFWPRLMRSQLAMDGDVDVATVFGYQYAYLRIFGLRLCSLNNTLLHLKFLRKI